MMTVKKTDDIDRRLSVAPMMDWTDRHCRFFHRLLAPDALLFTEMVTAEAVLHGDLDRLLGHDPAEHPLALQLGGSVPDRLAKATEHADQFGFQEINLNIGCPSDRVQSGRVGACLMAEPGLVADCVKAMQSATQMPVTVKCRIGIDDMDEETGLDEFVDTVSDAGVDVFYLHARKAWLNGLSPKENRDIPPLNYDRARRLAVRRPDLTICLNGGLIDCEMVQAELPHFTGVMIGRAAYKTPMLLADLNEMIFARRGLSRHDVANVMADYADKATARGVPLHSITRHMLGLYAGQRGAKYWRRTLGEEARSRDDGGALIRESAIACEARAAAWAA
ncbi:MAG: tRNA dihydrouridine(20/20a) synthase DusA [Alphaproteobacteria bacterium]